MAEEEATVMEETMAVEETETVEGATAVEGVAVHGECNWLLCKEEKQMIKLQFKSDSGKELSKEEIEKMRKDAEAHAEEDKKKKDEIETINQAEGLVHSSEKLFK